MSTFLGYFYTIPVSKEVFCRTSTVVIFNLLLPLKKPTCQGSQKTFLLYVIRANVGVVLKYGEKHMRIVASCGSTASCSFPPASPGILYVSGERLYANTYYLSTRQNEYLLHFMWGILAREKRNKQSF